MLPFAGVETIVVGAHVGAASAVKMSTASVYKGTSALLAHALLTADANGVLEHVLRDLRTGSPELVGERRATACERSLEVGSLRRRDARDRGDPGSRRAHARAVRRDGRRVRAPVHERARSVRTRGPSPDATLDDVLAGLEGARRTNVGS